MNLSFDGTLFYKKAHKKSAAHAGKVPCTWADFYLIIYPVKKSGMSFSSGYHISSEKIWDELFIWLSYIQ
jgi:hypothetical protein